MKSRGQNAVIRFFTTDGLRKVLALLLACLLYLTISTRNGTEQEVHGVPVSVELPSGKLLAGSVPSVMVKVKYNKNLRSIVSSAEVRARVSVPESACATGTDVPVRLEKQNFHSPLGVSIFEIEPQDLVLKVEDRIVKDIPVVPRYKGELPPDYRIKKVTFVPAKVQVSGPKSLVDQLTGISTREIPVTGCTYTFDYRTVLKEEPGISVIPNHVTATVEVEKSRGKRVFSGVPLAALNVSGQFQIEFLTSSNIEVTIAGPKSVLDALPKEQLHGFCDISALKQPGVYMIDTGCFLSRNNGLEIVSIYPEKVQIKLSR